MKIIEKRLAALEEVTSKTYREPREFTIQFIQPGERVGDPGICVGTHKIVIGGGCAGA